MKSKLILGTFLLMLFICPMIFISSYASPGIVAQPNMNKDFALSEDWYNEDWHYRKSISLKPASGSIEAGYQVLIEVPYDSDMKEDFADVIFVDEEQEPLLDHWLESYNETHALFWVEVQDAYSENNPGLIYMYYGNDEASSSSNGTATFLLFDDFDTKDTDKWDFSTYTSVAGGILTVGEAGHLGNEYFKSDNTYGPNVASESLMYDSGALKHNTGFSEAIPFVSPDAQASSHCTSGNGYLYEGNEDSPTSVTIPSSVYYIESVYWIEDYAELEIDRNLGGNGDKITEEDDDYPAIALLTGTNNWGSADTVTLFDWFFVRNWVAVEPYVESWGEEEDNFPPPQWEDSSESELIFVVPIDESGLNMLLIFLGLFMIPASTLYLVKGGKDEMSMDKLFYGLIAFVIGWALFLGGIM